MLNITVLENGNLSLSIPDAEDREELRDRLETESYWYVMAELFEDYSCNGSYTHFDSSAGNPFVGLTSAPCIAEVMDTDDDGKHTIEGNFWYFNDYAFVMETEELAAGREVIYTLYKES